MKISGAGRPQEAGPSAGLWERTHTWLGCIHGHRGSPPMGYLCGNTKVYFKGCGHKVMLSALHAASSVGLGQTRQRVFPLRWHTAPMPAELRTLVGLI